MSSSVTRCVSVCVNDVKWATERAAAWVRGTSFDIKSVAIGESSKLVIGAAPLNSYCRCHPLRSLASAPPVIQSRRDRRFSHTWSSLSLRAVQCSRRNCFDTAFGCESLAMIYKWELPSDARVTLIAHGEPVCYTRDIQNLPTKGRGAHDAVGSHTREQRFLRILTVREPRKPIFNVSSQYSLLLLRQIAERLE